MICSASATSASTISASGTTRTTLPFTNRWPLPAPGGDAEVGFTRLARAVHHAAHHRDLQRDVARLERGHGVARDLDHVDLGAPAPRARDEVEALALAQPQRLEQLTARLRLLDRVGGERVADRVADALGEQRADAGGRLHQPAGERPGLGDAEVQREVDGLRQQPVRVDHHRHVRRLHRDLARRRSRPRRSRRARAAPRRRAPRASRRRTASAMSGSRLPAFTPMRIGRPRSLASRATALMCSGLRMLPGLSRSPCDARLHRRERELVLEVDVGDDRHRRAGDDLRQALGRGLLVAGAAHDVAAGGGERVDLGQRAVDVGGLRGGHRLHRDRRRRPPTDGTERPRTCGSAAGACGAQPCGPRTPRWRARSRYWPKIWRMSRNIDDRPSARNDHEHAPR